MQPCSDRSAACDVPAAAAVQEDRYLAAEALNNLGFVHGELGHYDQGHDLCQQSFDQLQAMDRIFESIFPLSSLGEIAYRANDLEAAHSLLTDSLELFRQAGKEEEDAGRYILTRMAEVAERQGDVARAAALVEEAEVTAANLGDQGAEVSLQLIRARLQARQGQLDTAEAHWQTGVRLLRQFGQRGFLPQALTGLAQLSRHRGDLDRAATLLGAAAEWRKRYRLTLHPVDQDEWNTEVEAATTSLGPEGFEAAWDTGAAMSDEELFAYAIGT